MYNSNVKLNVRQKRILLEAMAKNHKILDGRGKCLSARRSQKVMWTELVAQLNKCGPEKHMGQWKKCWTDLRLAMKKKYLKSKKYRGKKYMLTDYEKYIIKACRLQDSDDESDHHPENEALLQHQPSVVKLEPTDEAVPETFEILDLNPELYCSEKDLIRDGIPIGQLPDVEHVRTTDLNMDSFESAEKSPLYQNYQTDNFNVRSSADVQYSTLERIAASNNQILIEIRKMHENVVNELKNQTALLKEMFQSTHSLQNKN